MKREMVYTGALITLGALLAGGCISHHHMVAAAPGEVIVAQAPPDPRHEVVTVAPSTEHIWVRGYWMNSNGRWTWIPGHYERRPRAGVAWVQGHWDRTSRGWVWTPGHWE